MQFGIPRRELLKTLPLAAVGATVAGKAAVSQVPPQIRSTLVVYFARTGNTTVIAKQIRRSKNADLAEIIPVDPYPEDYKETVSQASRETEAGYLPPLKPLTVEVARYDTLYLGFPIWGMTAPPVIRSFLRSNSLAGKTIYLFITHGGYGLGSSIEVLHSHLDGAKMQPAFSMEADQERRTLEQVTGWLG
ncbi:flavodoxin [Rhizobium sp. 2MFCol3.1]|uniref:flavodoxin n=1 Tax=Rhizobium sp. 2MFCol3.1 TaxID=1246459 RepID=UPI00036B34BC|nr:flavodoxin [Rhizobium sp. 2MFCol3.1]